MRMTKSKIIGMMWECGMPSTTAQYANVFFAARKAGLNNAQALALAGIAFHASKGYLEHLTGYCGALRKHTLERKAAESPRSIWAYLKHKLGYGFQYVTDAEIRDTSMNHHPEWAVWSDSLPQEVAQ